MDYFDDSSAQNGSGEASSGSGSELEQQKSAAQDAIDKLKRLQLLKEIEAVKPDHEQRQLAVEVCSYCVCLNVFNETNLREALSWALIVISCLAWLPGRRRVQPADERDINDNG